MKNNSIWLKDINFKNNQTLDKSIDVDVLIIGGGMTGLSTAYHLKDSNLKVCVVEKNLIAHGVSSRTTGKLTYLQDNIYTKLKDKGLLYYKSQKDAIEIVKDIINSNNIKCDLLCTDSYLYTDQSSEISLIKTEEEFLRKMKIDFKSSKELPNDLKCKYSINVADTYVFHPIKYLVALKDIILKSGISIYENSSVTSIKKEDDKYKVLVNNNIITALKVVVATHYPFFLYPSFVPLKTYIEKSYISASIISNIKDFSAITVSQPVKSMRYHKDKNNYFIYLNRSHNLCVDYDEKENFNNLIKDLKKMKINADYIWSNHDIMTEDNLPYIGYIDDNLLVGTGYNTWGMTNGSLAGKIISDLILGIDNPYSDLFNPKRSKNFNVLKYPIYMSYSAKSFVENKLIKNKFWYNDNVKFMKKNGKNIAIYTDSENIEHVVYNLCPHMKCSLIFNEVEKTWDCPCHGSRFDIYGKCISGPSCLDITYKE